MVHSNMVECPYILLQPAMKDYTVGPPPPEPIFYNKKSKHPIQEEPAILVTKDLEVQVEKKRDMGAFPVVKETSRTTQDGDLDGDCQQNPE